MELITKPVFILTLLALGTFMIVAGLTSTTVGKFRGWFVVAVGAGCIGVGLYLG